MSVVIFDVVVAAIIIIKYIIIWSMKLKNVIFDQDYRRGQSQTYF